MTPYVISGNSISLFLNGKAHVVDNTHPSFEDIRSSIQNGADPMVLQRLVNIRDSISAELDRQGYGDVRIGYDTVFYQGQPVHNHLTERMFAFIHQGLDIRPWALFLDNVMKNPNSVAAVELYLWLEQSGMPLTSDGCFLAYKKVRDDYGSYHDSGKTSNKIGEKPSMPREQVDPDRHQTCSQGLHFCSHQYLPSYMGNRGRVMVVKVNPADVVAIPSDYNNAKGRAWTYEVVEEVPEADAAFAFPPVVECFLWDDSELGFLDEDEDEDEDEPTITETKPQKLGFLDRIRKWMN